MKHKIFYIIAVAIFVAWMGLSTPIISQMSGEDKLRKINFSDVPSKDTVYWDIEVESATSNLLEISGFQGYAFVETEEDSSNRMVSLIFRGEEACYEVPADLYKRGKSLRSRFPSKRAPQSNYLGFFVDFTTLRMRNGVYDLYIYCWENETNYGVIDTGYQVEKQNGTFIKYPVRGEIVDTLPVPTQEENFSVAIDKAQMSPGGFVVRGWAVIPGEDCASRKVYIALTDENGENKQYLARSEIRLDVSDESFGDSRYENSGYIMSLPAEDFPDGSWRMKFLIENNGKVWESFPYGLIKTGDYIAIRSYIWGGYKLHTPLTVSQVQTNMTAIEQLRIADGNFIMSGWAAVPGCDSANQSVYISLTDGQGVTAQYTTRRETREDIADIFNDPNMRQTGYAINIPTGEMATGLWEVQVLVENEGEVWGSEIYRLEKTKEGVAILWDSEELRTPLVPSQTAKLSVAVDEAVQVDDNITIRGWAIVPELDCSTQKVYVELTDESGKATQYAAYSVMRMDVSSGLGNLMYTNSGYVMTLPADKLPDGKWKIKLLIENDGEIWESYTYGLVKHGEQVDMQQ